MNATVDNLFRLVQEYSPLEVGIEITGQQGGFISWVQNEMASRNIYFNLSKGKNGNNIGIRPIKDKMSRFQESVVPLFKMKKIWFPEELKDSDELKEMMVELQLATVKGFKSKHDDQIDTISMLAELNTWKPSEVSVEYDEDTQAIPGTSLWGSDDIKVTDNSYFV